jgi:hypothetical protein
LALSLCWKQKKIHSIAKETLKISEPKFRKKHHNYRKNGSKLNLTGKSSTLPLRVHKAQIELEKVSTSYQQLFKKCKIAGQLHQCLIKEEKNLHNRQKMMVWPRKEIKRFTSKTRSGETR